MGTMTSCSGTTKPMPNSNRTCDTAAWPINRPTMSSGVTSRSDGMNTATRTNAMQYTSEYAATTVRSRASIDRARRSRASPTS